MLLLCSFRASATVLLRLQQDRARYLSGSACKMGGTLSHLGSNIASMTPTSLKGLVHSAGLPLEVDDSFSSSELHEPKKV